MSADTTICASDSDRIATRTDPEHAIRLGIHPGDLSAIAALVDLENDGLHWPTLWSNPTDDAIAKLEREAIRCRAEHRQTANPTGLKARLDLGERVTPFAPTKGTRQ